MALDVLLVFTANPEDYTARGKIITPLKDRIGSEIRTHYPATVAEGMSITAQESWTEARQQKAAWTCRNTFAKSSRKLRFRRARISAWTGGPASASGCRSARSKMCSAAPNSAPIRNRDRAVVARVADVYAAIPSMTGKFELEYEGEMRGAENIARELIRAAVGKTFTQVFPECEFSAGGAMVRDRRRTEGSRTTRRAPKYWPSSRQFRAFSST